MNDITTSNHFEQTVLAAVERILRPVVEQMKDQPRQEWFSIKQAAALTGLEPKHIWRATRQGKLACSNLGVGEKRATIRIARRDIEAWAEAGRVKHAPAKSERDALVEHYFGRTKKRKPSAA